jgi:hypothetical protein
MAPPTQSGSPPVWAHGGMRASPKHQRAAAAPDHPVMSANGGSLSFVANDQSYGEMVGRGDQNAQTPRLRGNFSIADSGVSTRSVQNRTLSLERRLNMVTDGAAQT